MWLKRVMLWVEVIQWAEWRLPHAMSSYQWRWKLCVVFRKNIYLIKSKMRPSLCQPQSSKYSFGRHWQWPSEIKNIKTIWSSEMYGITRCRFMSNRSWISWWCFYYVGCNQINVANANIAWYTRMVKTDQAD